jgi:hypothetical protein
VKRRETWRRTRGLDSSGRKLFAFLLERLDQAPGDAAPDVEEVLGRIDPSRLPKVSVVLLHALRSASTVSTVSYEQALRRAVGDLEAGLRMVRAARRILRHANPTLFTHVALAEVEQELRNQLKASPFVAAVKAHRARRGRPASDAVTYLDRLRACGVSRDDARELVRAVRVAQPYSWPAQPKASTLPFTLPSLVDLAERRAAAEK